MPRDIVLNKDAELRMELNSYLWSVPVLSFRQKGSAHDSRRGNDVSYKFYKLFYGDSSSGRRRNSRRGSFKSPLRNKREDKPVALLFLETPTALS